jgi:glucans biosynthesis protein
MDGRSIRALGLVLAAVVLLGSDCLGATFGFAEVADRARQLSEQPYQDPTGQVPEWLRSISYDQWRDIRFRPEDALWGGGNPLGFSVQFFHPGLFYDRMVRVHVVDLKGVHVVPFEPSHFDYGSNDFASRVPQDLGYAGFRVHYPIKTPRYADEVIVFLGASYFRALGRDEVFGLSARGVAIDTAEKSGEEFPYFREFWLLRPARGARTMTIFALLDGRSLTGAYRFEVTPGEETTVSVDAKLFRRQEVAKLGIAPLTSMFLFGEGSLHRPQPDYRPEVHDSDGLQVLGGTGEWIWRPLQNPARLTISSFQTIDPAGFGLLQRDRDFDHYQDLEAHAERRPSVWIEPQGAWGAGRVELVEIPSERDTNDNIVAYWVPGDVPAMPEPVSFAYRMSWFGDDVHHRPPGRVVATRRDLGGEDGAQRFIVDFEGDQLAKLPASEVVQGVVSIAPEDTGTKLVGVQVMKNDVTQGWRLVFQVQPAGNQALDLRAFLRHGGETLTETWTYLLQP